MNFTDYVDQYNMGDYAALVHKFYTDDIVFESGAMERVCRGQDEVIDFLTSMQVVYGKLFAHKSCYRTRIIYLRKPTWTSMR